MPEIPRGKPLIAAFLALALAGVLALPAFGAVTLHTLPIEALRSNLLGDPAEIRVAVYLPPGYEQAPDRRYPAIYLLHGWLGSIDQFGVSDGKPGFQGMQLASSMDAAIARGTIRDTIVVVPEARNGYFGSFYANSTVNGRWEDALVHELVPWVDARYRTVPSPAARGIAGFSMGGYGAIMLSMKYPEIFGAVYALSPCCLGLLGDLGPDNPWWENAGRLRSREEMKSNPASAEESFPIFVTALAAALSPNPERPGLYVDLPFASVGGQLQRSEPGHSAWTSRMPVYLVGQHQDDLRRLNGMYLDVGAEDEYAQIRAGARALSQELASRGIAHTFEIYAQGTHTSMIRQRIETSVLPFFSRTLRETSQEYQPYPSPRITPEQWAAYGETVRQNHGDTAEIYKDKRLVGFSDQRTRTFWVFTMKGHPAHPAFITRQLFEEGGEVRVRQIGFFAGSEQEFAKLFSEYLERNESLKDEVGRRNR